MALVCLAAQMRSGKDVIADYIVERYGKLYNEKWAKRGWAEGLKSVVSDCFGISRGEIEMWKTESMMPPDYIVTMRQALQMVGDGFRQIKPDVWIAWTLNKSQPMVIPDGRYINELIAVHDADGVNVLIIRPGFENADPHPSEAQMKPVIDYYASALGGKFEGEVTLEMFRHLCDTHDLTPPSGAANIDFVLRNDGTLEELKRKVDAVLIPYLAARFGYSTIPNATCSSDPKDLDEIPVEDLLPSSVYCATQGGYIDPTQPIWGRMGEGVMYKQNAAGVTITPPAGEMPIGRYEILTQVMGLSDKQAEIILEKICAMETGECCADNGVAAWDRINAAQSLKGAQLMSTYDILVDWMKYSPEKANDMIARMKAEKLEDLKMQILNQNPMLMGGCMGDPDVEDDIEDAEFGEVKAPEPDYSDEIVEGENSWERLERRHGLTTNDLFALYGCLKTFMRGERS